MDIRNIPDDRPKLNGIVVMDRVNAVMCEQYKRGNEITVFEALVRVTEDYMKTGIYDQHDIAKALTRQDKEMIRESAYEAGYTIGDEIEVSDDESDKEG